MSNEPSPLQVKNDNDWEEISCYLMSSLILRRYNAQVRFQRYGRNGQMQHGVDVLTLDPAFSNILGQAKYKTPGHALEPDDVLDTLQKTSTYPNDLHHMILLTNGLKNTKVDDLLVETKTFYTNQCGVTFGFEVIYWHDVTNFDFIPYQELLRFFPEQAQIAGLFVQDPYEIATRAARMLIPRYLTEQDMLEVRKCATMGTLPSAALDMKIIDLCQGLQKAKVLAQDGFAFGADPDAQRLRPIVQVTERLYQALSAYRPSYLSLVLGSESKAWNNYARAAEELEEAYYQVIREPVPPITSSYLRAANRNSI